MYYYSICNTRLRHIFIIHIIVEYTLIMIVTYYISDTIVDNSELIIHNRVN